MARGNKPKTDKHCLTGFHLVRSVLRHHPSEILGIWVDQSRQDMRMKSILQLAEDSCVMVHRGSRKQIDRISGGLRHQGILAILSSSPADRQHVWESFLKTLNTNSLLLVLDQIQDPHNLGACIRTAECAGVDAVIVPRDGAAPVNETVRRVAVGAAERMPIHYVTNLVRSLHELKDQGVWVIGTSDHAKDSLHQADLSGSVAFVFGAEDKGIRRLTQKVCDFSVRIPMAGSVSSLNVSVATGVVLFEAKRQRDLLFGRQP